MPVGIITWINEQDFLAKPKLDQEIRVQGMALTVMRTISTPIKSYGQKKGSTVQITKSYKLTVDTTPISELSSMPLESLDYGKITVTVEEYGRGVGETHKVSTLSELDETANAKQMLSQNMSETLDKLAYEKGFSAGDYFYVPTGTDSSPNGVFESTLSTSATRHIQLYDLQRVVTKLKTMNVPKYDGAYYVGIFSPSALFRLFRDTSTGGIVELFKYAQPEVLIRGELGSIYGLRIIEETNALPSALGNTSYEGEFIVCGSEPVVEALALPENLRTNRWDFDRFTGIAWVCITGFAPVWKFTEDSYTNMIRVTSA